MYSGSKGSDIGFNFLCWEEKKGCCQQKGRRYRNLLLAAPVGAGPFVARAQRSLPSPANSLFEEVNQLIDQLVLLEAVGVAAVGQHPVHLAKLRDGQGRQIISRR